MSFIATDLASSYQKLLERIRAPAWLMDGAGRIYLANIAWENYTGRSLSNSQPCFLWDLFSLEQKEITKDRWQQNSPLKKWQNNYHLQDSQGKYSLFNLELELLTEDRDPQLWIGTAYSRTGQAIAEAKLADYKQKELKLQSNIEFVRRIVESSPDCIKVLDLQGRILYMNDGGQNIMEIDDFARVQYAPWLTFWHDCDREKAIQALAIANGGEIARFDGYCATAKGTPKWWEVIVTPMLDENNQVQEILSIYRDITARKTAEETLKQRNHELNRFTYIVSHDLKAPLRGIANLAQWLAEDLGEQVSPESKQHLDLLDRRVQRMDTMINSLLQFSRVGRQTLATETIDLAELIAEVIDSLTPPADFKITYASLPPTITTKRLFLTQVLSNLISNAIKHHDRDTGQIEITAQDCQTHYQFAIADDGPGVMESAKERIFEIFQTGDSDSSTLNTGIGLAIVKKIVEQEGGKLWLVENTPRGCKFLFTRPKTPKI
ncbi:hypothetical protein C7B62_04080 [Pleurocapsa sp. CCALA 161]|uniref:sensor histidine kinase n=1 Tax=Pleurocapsa sp. CCALA 161 TaxID=2107688 RepID=UPI000D0657E0|nr:ATP-binding protein [Pleurocapsa sp. CCALA 161]PSB11905.1 hypothetical protein C7B62_04080 [Pleurocapsa sp. CCALA 161]